MEQKKLFFDKCVINKFYIIQVIKEWQAAKVPTLPVRDPNPETGDMLIEKSFFLTFQELTNKVLTIFR